MKKLLNIIILFIMGLFLSGCATLNYVGEDYSANNNQTIKTNEDFVFNTYKKSLNNINLKAGISKTAVPEILALYIQIENLSYETPYIFKVEDLRLYNSDGEIQFITTNNYLNIYQTQEAQAMSSMGAMGATFSNMAGMSTNYNEYNQTIAQNASEASNKSAFSRMETIGNQILNHSIKYSSTVNPRRSQYYYFFFQDLEKFPITVKYKTLNYQFNL